jgi:hypothetical protein
MQNIKPVRVCGAALDQTWLGRFSAGFTAVLFV